MKKLVSDISHQTRTPLSNILLYSELLSEQAEKKEEKRTCRTDFNADGEIRISHSVADKNVEA